MRIFIEFCLGAVAILCAAAFVSAGFRARVLRHMPLSRRTYAIAAAWFFLAMVIVAREGMMPYGRLQRLRLTGAALSVLAIGSHAWDYRRHRLVKSKGHHDEHSANSPDGLPGDMGPDTSI